MAGPRVGKRGTVALNLGHQAVEGLLQLRQVGSGCEATLGLGHGGGRLRMRFAQARQRFGECGAPHRQFAGRLFGLVQRIARRVEPMLRVTPALAGEPLGFGSLAGTALGVGQRLFGGAQDFRRGDGFGIELGEAVLLGKALRGGGRRIGAGHHPVPAPQRAVAADQPLAGRQRPGEPSGIGRLDDADLGKPARQRGRRLHDVGQRHDALRQLRIAWLLVAVTPIGRRAAVERQVEIFAERRTQRGLIAALDLDLLHHRRKQVAARGIEDLGQRAGLGLDARQLGPRLLQRPALRRLVLPQRRDRLRRQVRPARRPRPRSRPLRPAPVSRPGRQGRRCGCRHRRPRASTSATCAPAGRGARRRRAADARTGGGRRPPRRARRSAPASAASLAASTRRRLGDRGAHVVLAAGSTRHSRRKARPLRRARRSRTSALSLQHLLFARDVGVELGDALVELGLAARGCGRPPPRAARGRSTGAGRRRRPPLRRRAVPAGDARRSPGPWRRPSAPTRARRPTSVAVASADFASAFLRLGQRPAQMQQRRLGLADIGRQVLEAGCLPRLPFQAFDLASRARRRRRPAVRGSARRPAAAAPPRGGGVCRPEMPAASSSRARRACGLAWISSPMRPCPTIEGERAPVDCVGKQQLHVLGARFLAVDAIDRACFALDAARHLQFVGVVEGGGRGAVANCRGTASLRRCCATGRVAEPEKITSSMPDARMFL